MPLFDDAGNIPASTIVRPGQIDQTGDINATAVTEYGQEVEHSIKRTSEIAPFIRMRTVRGTNKIGAFAVGQTALQKLVVGQAPAGTGVDIGKNTLTIDSVVIARETLPLLESFQTQYDMRVELGMEHGESIARFMDQSFFIQAIQTARLVDSPYSATANKPAGFKGGSQVTLDAVGDENDPAKLYQAISDLFVRMEQKDVSPRKDDVMIAVRPQEFYTLQAADQIVNGTYLTAQGTRIDAMIFKAFGCPVVSSNNIPSGVVADHLLGSTFNGDFTKVVATAFSPRKALLSGQTIPLANKVWFNDEYKMWFVDSWISYSVGPNRPEFAGVIQAA